MLDSLFWELVYWKTPDDYERVTAGEQVHLGALDVARVDDAVVWTRGGHRSCYACRWPGARGPFMRWMPRRRCSGC